MEKAKTWLLDAAKRRLLVTAAAGVSLGFSLGGWAKPFDPAWVAVVLCGVPIVCGALKALVVEHDIKADLLVSMALLGSLYIGEWFAAGEVAFIMQIGSILEDATAAKTREGIGKLVRMTPKTARVKRNGAEKVVPAEEVEVGDIVAVFAGETVPVDGVILSGSTSIDQSVMTGESIPVDKAAGDEVTSGTVNRFGTFEMNVTRKGEDSALQRMIRLAREADANKAPIVSLADRWAGWMVVVSFLTAVVTGLVTGEFVRAVTVLVVFCPCAFVLATPTAVMAGIGNATKHGILVRSGDALERFSKIRKIAFDKTGTLTNGTPRVIAVRSLSPDSSEEDVLRIAAAAESRSEHPLGKAICAACPREERPDAIAGFTVVAGQGVRCAVGGEEVLAGKAAWLRQEGVRMEPGQAEAEQEYRKIGATVIYLARGTETAGLIALADTVRRDAKPMIEQLKRGGIRPVLLTGDNRDAAFHIAAQVGIEDVRPNLLPEDKMEMIDRYRKQGEAVCMVGDGINDALALGTAYAAIAMGGIGSDIAVESSDAVLVKDDIQRIPYLLSISEKTMKKVNFNILFSMALNFLAVALAVTGILHPVWGALVHNCGSVFVVVNSARLLRAE